MYQTILVITVNTNLLILIPPWGSPYIQLPLQNQRENSAKLFVKLNYKNIIMKFLKNVLMVGRFKLRILPSRIGGLQA